MPGLNFSSAITTLLRVTRPVFTSRRDRVVYAAHAYHLCQGYILIGLGKPEELNTLPEDAPEIPFDGWNDSQDLYIFKYRDESDKLLPVILKCAAIANTLVICVESLDPEHQETRTLNISVEEFTTESPDLIRGYQALEKLVDQFSQILGEFRREEKEPEIPPGMGLSNGCLESSPSPIHDKHNTARGSTTRSHPV